MKKAKDTIIFSDPLLFEKEDGDIIGPSEYSGVTFEVVDDEVYNIDSIGKKIIADEGTHLKFN